MRYQVPQFIEVEDKIFGPLTFRQFVYLGGAGGMALIFFTLMPLILAFVLSAPVVALGLALAFYKVNGRPFIVALEHALSYLVGTKLYLWSAEKPTPKKAEEVVGNAQTGDFLGVPKLSESKLRDLSWSLNIKDRKKMGVDTNASSEFRV